VEPPDKAVLFGRIRIQNDNGISGFSAWYSLIFATAETNHQETWVEKENHLYNFTATGYGSLHQGEDACYT